ncbi:phage/plasmid primase, P4 family [Mesorhizobium sp. M1322]
MIWDGSRWRSDRCTVRESIRRICRNAAAAASDSAGAVRIASAAKVMAVEALARSDARLMVDDERWDANPWLLNTLSGAVDLVTGEIHTHDPDLLMTRMAAASAEGLAPRWRDFLDSITDRDADLQGYLQRVAGYCLTGSTREHAMFFLLGSGSNGKSVFTNALRTILGDYAVASGSDLLTATNMTRHPTELAALRYVRLVLVPEVERRSRFAESRMKSLTGGDQIAARLMRQDFSTFTPQFKLIITGNQMPVLDGVDEAVRRRLHIIPFRRKISAAERDVHLTEKLLAERDGILAWAVQGCLAWQETGLCPPASVRELSELYFENQDAVGRFIVSCCEIDVGYSIGSTELYRFWSSWAREQSEQEGSQRAFVQELQARGYLALRTAQRRAIRGLRLKARASSEVP